MKYIAALAFVLSVAVANWTTATFGLIHILGLSFTAGTLAAGAALILRDAAQEKTGNLVTVAAIIAGALLSAVTSNIHIAMASGLAFLASEIADFAVYNKFRHRNRPLAVVISSVAAAPVDTFLFLSVAGFPVTTASITGQFIVKTIMALIVGAGLHWRSISQEA